MARRRPVHTTHGDGIIARPAVETTLVMTDALEHTAGTAPDALVPDGAMDFVPPWRLRHPHLQSIYPSLPMRRPGVVRRCAQLLRASRQVIVECGEGVRLLADIATQE